MLDGLLATAVRFLPPLTPAAHASYTQSRIAVFADGTTRPVLQVLAEERFGRWNAKHYFPFWLDGDPTNETPANVELCPRGKTRAYRKLGLSGPDYHKKWRAANPEQWKQIVKRSRLRRKAIHEMMKAKENAA